MPLKLLQLVPKVPVKVRAAQSKFCDNSASPQDVGEDETQTGVHRTRCEPRRRQSITVMESTSAVTLPSRQVFHHSPGNIPADWATGARCSYSDRARRQSVGSFPSEDMKLLPEQSLPRPARRQSVGSCSGSCMKLTDENFPFSLGPQLLDFGQTSRAGLGTTTTRPRPSLGENTAALWRSESRDDNGSEVSLIQPADRRRNLLDTGDFGLTTFEAQPTLDALLRHELLRKDCVAAGETSRPHQPQRRHSCHGNFASMSRDAASYQMIPVESTDPDASNVTVDELQTTGNMSRVTITSSVDPLSTDQDACSSRRHRSWRKSAHALIFISRLSRPGPSRLTPINEAPCEATVTTTGSRDDDISTNSAAAADSDDDDDATTTTTTTTSLQRYADETENGNGNDPEARNGEAGAIGGEVEGTNDASDSSGNRRSGGRDQENGEGLEDSGGTGGSDGDGGGRDGEEEDPGRNEAAGISNLRQAANGNRVPSLRTLCLQTTFSGFREVRSEDDQSMLSRQTLANQQFFFNGTNVVCAYCNNAALNDGFVDLSHSHRLLTGDALNSVINPHLRARFQQLSSWMGVQPRYYDNVNLENLGVHRRNL